MSCLSSLAHSSARGGFPPCLCVHALCVGTCASVLLHESRGPPLARRDLGRAGRFKPNLWAQRCITCVRYVFSTKCALLCTYVLHASANAVNAPSAIRAPPCTHAHRMARFPALSHQRHACAWARERDQNCKVTRTCLLCKLHPASHVNLNAPILQDAVMPPRKVVLPHSAFWSLLIAHSHSTHTLCTVPYSKRRVGVRLHQGTTLTYLLSACIKGCPLHARGAHVSPHACAKGGPLTPTTR